ncbi:MAG: hypothetical protein QG671_2023 [Actinomycetota bacterium]|nr:hypothetical protein [Actinomycetota bacterium]
MDSWVTHVDIMVLAGAVFCCIGIWSLIKIFTETIKMIIRKVRWVEGWARVLDVKAILVGDSSDSAGHYEYNAYVVLTTADESQFAGWTKEVPFFFDKDWIGREMRAWYDPKDPERFFALRKPAIWRGVLYWGFFTVIFLTTGSAAVVTGLMF